MKKNIDSHSILYLVKSTLLWAVALIWITPIIGILVASVRSSDEIVNGWWTITPFSLDFSNYYKVLFSSSIPLVRPILNSLFISLVGTTVSMMLGSMAGYGLMRFDIPLKLQIVVSLIATMSAPFQMLIIPVFKIMNFLNLLDTPYSVIIMHIVTSLPWITFFIMNFMRTQSDTIEEAARIDGCSDWGVFMKIVVPNIYSALLAVFALQFVWSWIDFFFPLIFLYSPEKLTVVQVIPLLRGHFVANWGDLSAASVITIFFPFLVFFFLQRYYILAAAGWQGEK